MFAKAIKDLPPFANNWRPKVLVTNRDIPRVGLDLLEERCDVTYTEGLPQSTRKEILQLIRGVDAVIWSNVEKVNAEMLDAAGPQLKVISTYPSGYDYIDVKEVRKRNILLGNTGIASKDPVAEVAVGLMIITGRRLYEGFLKIKASQWEKRPQFLLSSSIAGSTVGIIGFGTIGQKIAKRLEGFEIREFLYSGHKPKSEAEALNAWFTPLDDLLRRSDYVILSCPLNAETKHLINRETLAKMKPTSVLINVARGEVVDQDALLEALQQKKIFAAGLDVTAPEPLPADHPLLNLSNCFITPHIGSATKEIRDDMSVIASLNVLQGLAGVPMICPIP